MPVVASASDTGATFREPGHVRGFDVKCSLSKRFYLFSPVLLPISELYRSDALQHNSRPWFRNSSIELTLPLDNSRELTLRWAGSAILFGFNVSNVCEVLISIADRT